MNQKTLKEFTAMCDKAAKLKSIGTRGAAGFALASKMANRAGAVTPEALNVAYAAAQDPGIPKQTAAALLDSVLAFFAHKIGGFLKRLLGLSGKKAPKDKAPADGQDPEGGPDPDAGNQDGGQE